MKKSKNEIKKTILSITASKRIKNLAREFHGGPVVRTPRFHGRGHGFNP